MLNCSELFSFLKGMALLTILVGCHMPVVDNNDVERAKHLPLIEYTYLSSEKTNPFPWKGIDNEKTRLVKKAVADFPAVADCLKKQSSEDLDLRLINWKKINSREELNVCLWRIFSSLEGHLSIFEWLSFHKLLSGGWSEETAVDPATLKSYKMSRFTPYPDGTRAYSMSFTWYGRPPFKDKDPLPFSAGLMVILPFEVDSGRLMGVSSQWEPVK